MAKIYETPEDLERERLALEAKKLRHDANEDSISGLALVGLSAANLTIDNLEQFKASTLKQERGWFNKLSKPIGYLAAATGIFSFTTSFSGNSKAKKAEADLKKLGSEQIVLPGDKILSSGESVSIVSMQKSSTEQAKSI